jgi:D-arabinose 1-dehydrogenase-like Zn-dependent alcohol dehydrogenase
VCRKCEFCTNGVDECHCPTQLNSGFSIAGTFQEYCVTDARYATRLPDGVSDEEAGPLLCGGVTAYTGCKRSGVKPGQWLVIPGAGGGTLCPSMVQERGVCRMELTWRDQDSATSRCNTPKQWACA